MNFIILQCQKAQINSQIQGGQRIFIENFIMENFIQFRAGSSKTIHFSDVTLNPALIGNVVGMIR
jgi:hypothetical protein